MPVEPFDSIDASLGEAMPIIARVVSSRLNVRVHVSASRLFESHHDDAVECCTVAAGKLGEKLRRVEAQTDPPLESLANYAATVANSAVNEMFRTRAPRRASFANRVRRALEQAQFSTWEQSNLQVAGYAGWRVLQRTPASLANVSALARDLKTDSLLATGWSQMDARVLGRVLARVFDIADGPIEINELITFLVELLRVPLGRGTSLNGDDGDGTGPPPVAPAPSHESRLIVQAELRKFWDCAQALRREWLLSLILNPPSAPESAGRLPKDDDRQRDRNRGTLRGEIDVLPANGIASIAEIGRVLQLTPEQYALIARRLQVPVRVSADAGSLAPFYDIWPHLPLPDRLIGELLGTDKQIAALRRSACRQVALCMTGSDRAPTGHIRASVASAPTARTDR